MARAMTVLVTGAASGIGNASALQLIADGHEVVAANSAQEALRLLNDKTFDLVLSDQLMPDMTGTQLARIIKESHQTLPIILISGVNEVPPDAGYADLFVSKLEGPAALCQKILEVLQQKELKAEAEKR